MCERKSVDEAQCTGVEHVRMRERERERADQE